MCRFTPSGDPDASAFTLQTVDGNMKALSAREQLGVKAAVELIRNSGYEAIKSLASALKHGTFNNAPCTSKNLYDAIRVYGGEPEAGAKGKGHVKAIPTHAIEPTDILIASETTLEADLFFIDKLTFLLSVSSYGYAMASYLGASLKGVRLASSVWDYLRLHFSAYTAKGQKVTSLKADPEGCFGANRLKIEESNVTFIPTTAENKCKHVERRIQYIKNKDRSIKAGLPFPLFGALLVFCVLTAVRLSNFFPVASSPIGISPVEVFTGIRPDYKRDIPHGFGDYGLVTPPQSDPPAAYNSSAPRRESSLYIWNDKVWSLRSQRILGRVKFEPRAMPSEVVVYLHQLAQAANHKSRYRGVWRTSTGVLSDLSLDDDEHVTVPNEQLIPLQRNVLYPGEFFDDPSSVLQPILPSTDTLKECSTVSDVTLADLDEVAAEADDTDSDDDVEFTGVSPTPPTLHADNFALPPTADTLAGVEHMVDSAPTTEEETKYDHDTTADDSKDERRYPTRANRTSWQQRRDRQAFHVKVKTALKSYKKSGLIAMIKELKSVALDKKL